MTPYTGKARESLLQGFRMVLRSVSHLIPIVGESRGSPVWDLRRGADKEGKKPRTLYPTLDTFSLSSSVFCSLRGVPAPTYFEICGPPQPQQGAPTAPPRLAGLPLAFRNPTNYPFRPPWGVGLRACVAGNPPGPKW